MKKLRCPKCSSLSILNGNRRGILEHAQEPNKHIIYPRFLTFYDWIAFIILILAGINWGLYGIFNINLVDKLGNLLFNQAQFITKAYFSAVIYLIFGIAGVYGIYLGFKLMN